MHSDNYCFIFSEWFKYINIRVKKKYGTVKRCKHMVMESEPLSLINVTKGIINLVNSVMRLVLALKTFIL